MRRTCPTGALHAHSGYALPASPRHPDGGEIAALQRGDSPGPSDGITELTMPADDGICCAPGTQSCSKTEPPSTLRGRLVSARRRRTANLPRDDCFLPEQSRRHPTRPRPDRPQSRRARYTAAAHHQTQSPALRGGCRKNPEPALWTRSKAGHPEPPSHPSGLARASRRRRGRRLSSALPPGRRSISQMALCDSLRRKRQRGGVARSMDRLPGKRLRRLAPCLNGREH